MKQVLSAALVAAGLALLPLSPSLGQVVQGRVVRPTDVSRAKDPPAEPISVDVGVAFSDEYGQTVTDENGTFYNVFGWSFFTDKVYPPEYWGVFPLYFFDSRVGILMTVTNTSAGTSAKVRLRQECYCLRTDGSNGAELTDPTEDDVAVAAGDSAAFDASFWVNYTPYAEEGLDRFLINVYKPDTLDENNGNHVLGGEIDINPNNKADSEFVLTMPDGTRLTRDDLRDDYAGYQGEARRIHLKPKGNGTQEGFIVDGQPYPIVNSKTYDIMSDSMTVNVTHDMGHWSLGVDGTGATILVLDDANPLISTHEAVFCPPDVNSEVAEIARSLEGSSGGAICCGLQQEPPAIHSVQIEALSFCKYGAPACLDMAPTCPPPPCPISGPEVIEPLEWHE